MKEKKRTLGLYLHIPFCRSKCLYCDFYSLPSAEEQMDRYVAALCRHLVETAPRAACHQVDTVYFGGGTPSYLGSGRLEQLLKTVEKHYALSRGAEITLEANPDSLRDWRAVRALRRRGVNRISLGVQSTDDGELRSIGRVHTFSRWMYWGEEHVFAATSEDLVNWTPYVNTDGSLRKLFSPRDGHFDSQLTECGPPAIYTPKGIVLLYNGKNSASRGDKRYTANVYAAGQALFDANDPTRFITRLDEPFFRPMDSFEKSGQYDGTVFIEGMVYIDNHYYNEHRYVYYAGYFKLSAFRDG